MHLSINIATNQNKLKKYNIIAIIPFLICAFVSYNQIVLAQRNVLHKQSRWIFQNGNLILGLSTRIDESSKTKL